MHTSKESQNFRQYEEGEKKKEKKKKKSVI
jgi:hypothetical protein